MFSILRSFARSLPTLILSILLAVTVWVVAVTAADPTEEQAYPRPVTIEIVGQDPSLILTSSFPDHLTLTLSAPRSIWDSMIRESVPVRAVADFSGLGAGKQVVPIQVQVGIRPVKVVSYSPSSLEVTLEAVSSRSMPIHLLERGDPAVGFQVDVPQLNVTLATITGPDSLVNQVKEIAAVLDISHANENLEKTLDLQAVDASGNAVSGLTLNPAQVKITVNVSQRGGYRNVVVKVALQGQIAPGYRITNISVFPPVVTVFSSNPALVESLPGYVETSTLDLTGAQNVLDSHLKLNLPNGVSTVDVQDVEVQVGITSIDGSLTLQKIPVEIINLGAGLTAHSSPALVDIIITGPLALLDSLRLDNIHVTVDIAEQGPGTLTLTPNVELGLPILKVQSILPPSLEVIITQLEITPTPSLIPTVNLTITPTPKPK